MKNLSLKRVEWLIVCCFLTIGNTIINAQEELPSIKGIVYNAIDSTPIDYAHIGIPSNGSGVISNRAGAFHFFFNRELQNDTLVISHLGLFQTSSNPDNPFFKKRNHLFELFDRNPIRNYYYKKKNDNGRTWFGNRFLKEGTRVKAWIKGRTTYNGNQVYHIGYKSTVEEGEIFIDVQDYGIYRLVSTVNFNGSNLPEEIVSQAFYDGKFMRKSTFDYKKIGDRYYLAFIEHTGLDPFRKKSDGVKNTAGYVTNILMVNQVITDKKAIKRIRRRKAHSNEKDMHAYNGEYNSRFWLENNILINTPLEEKVIKDLEFEETLEEQFKANSN